MDTISRLYAVEDREVRSLDIDVPAYVEQDISCGTLAAIVEGGCASGAYMPAVTYYDARNTMASDGDAVFQALEDAGMAPAEIVSGCGQDSWDGWACTLLSAAVELWAGGAAEEVSDALDAVEEDDDEDDIDDRDPAGGDDPEPAPEDE